MHSRLYEKTPVAQPQITTASTTEPVAEPEPTPATVQSSPVVTQPEPTPAVVESSPEVSGAEATPTQVATTKPTVKCMRILSRKICYSNI